MTPVTLYQLDKVAMVISSNELVIWCLSTQMSGQTTLSLIQIESSVIASIFQHKYWIEGDALHFLGSGHPEAQLLVIPFVSRMAKVWENAVWLDIPLNTHSLTSSEHTLTQFLFIPFAMLITLPMEHILSLGLWIPWIGKIGLYVNTSQMVLEVLEWFLFGSEWHLGTSQEIRTNFFYCQKFCSCIILHSWPIQTFHNSFVFDSFAFS